MVVVEAMTIETIEEINESNDHSIAQLDTELIADLESNSNSIDPSSFESTSNSPSFPAAPLEQNEDGLDAFLLPQTIIKRIIASSTEGALFSKEAKTLCTSAATLFISYLTAACLEASNSNSSKKTLQPDDVLRGIEACGFKEMHSELHVALVEHRNSSGSQTGKKYRLESEVECEEIQ